VDCAIQTISRNLDWKTLALIAMDLNGEKIGAQSIFGGTPSWLAFINTFNFKLLILFTGMALQEDGSPRLTRSKRRLVETAQPAKENLPQKRGRGRPKKCIVEPAEAIPAGVLSEINDQATETEFVQKAVSSPTTSISENQFVDAINGIEPSEASFHTAASSNLDEFDDVALDEEKLEEDLVLMRKDHSAFWGEGNHFL
jgi:hypothetical protein